MNAPVSSEQLWNGIEWLRTRGSPRETGLQHGAELRLLAHFLYRDSARLPGGHEWQRQRGLLSARRSWLAEHWPAEVQELDGIAHAASVDPALVLLLCHQLGRRFPGWEAEASAAPPASACTGAVFRDTPSGTICGNTLDDGSPHFIHVHEGPAWCTHVAIQFAGILGGFGGLNEHGLYVGNSSGGVALDHRLPPSPDHSVPSLMTPLLILRYCHNVNEAIDLLRRPDVLGHGHHILADSAGNVAVVEKYLTWGPRVLFITHDACATGNVSLIDLMSGEAKLKEVCPPTSPICAPIWSRFLSMKHLIEASSQRDVEQMKRLLRSHHQHLPGVPLASVCNSETAVALIGIPKEKRLLIAGSPPCQQPFREVRFTRAGIQISSGHESCDGSRSS